MNSEPMPKGSTWPSRLWFILAFVSALSSILKYSFIGDVSAVLIIILEWYRWLTASLLSLINIDLPEVLVDIQIFVISIFLGVSRLNPHYRQIVIEVFTGKGLDLISPGREEDEKLFKYLFYNRGRNVFIMSGWNQPIFIALLYLLACDVYFAFFDGTFDPVVVILSFSALICLAYHLKIAHPRLVSESYPIALFTEIFSAGIFELVHFYGLVLGLAIFANLRLVALIAVALATTICVAVVAKDYFDPILVPYLEQYPRPPAVVELPRGKLGEPKEHEGILRGPEPTT